MFARRNVQRAMKRLAGVGRLADAPLHALFYAIERTVRLRRPSRFDLLIVSSANKQYQHYVLPFIVSSLLSNERSAVEVFVEAGFCKKYASGLAAIRYLFPGRSRLREVDFAGVHASTVRFTEAPLFVAEYVYIGDIDILMLIPAVSTHVPPMRDAGLQFSNRVRPEFFKKGVRRLTGCHFSLYDAYYPIAVPAGFDASDMRRDVDERLLYEIVRERCGEPPIDYQFRPMLGFHLSPHALPGREWAIRGVRRPKAYRALQREWKWKKMLPHFDPKYCVLLKLLDASLDALAAFAPEEAKGTKAVASLLGY